MQCHHILSKRLRNEELALQRINIIVLWEMVCTGVPILATTEVHDAIDSVVSSGA
jgi:hypothetical protein